MQKFELLKRIYPISKFERICDGYVFLENISEEERNKLDINLNDLQQTIKSGEKYIYQVAKDGNEFKTLSICFENFNIIRKKILKLNDE